jgi:hypothetical protein
MRVKQRFLRVLVGVIAVATPLTASATTSSAAPPPADPMPVSLTCSPGTYSFIQVLQLVDHRGNVVGTENLECGTGWDFVYPTIGYPDTVDATVSAKPSGYTFLDWRCASTGDLVGASTTQTDPVRFAKKGSTTVHCPTLDPTGGTDVTLTIG